MTPITLTPLPLTSEAFAPYGQVIEASDAANHFSINEGNTERYHDLARIEPGPEGHAIVSIFRGLPRTLPFEVTMMERHPLGSQAFIPMSGRPYLVVVAPAGDPPTVETLKVFYCRGDQGVNYDTGVWHHPLLALDAVSDFIIIDRSGPNPNCDIIELARRGVIAN
ncbi:MAG: ureidoglycolate lyase [Burkholderiaceae bacterium]|nr:ureidoglycolate lyase [Burkholderiaceae bacterium]